MSEANDVPLTGERDGLGKFSTDVDERVYEWSLDGCNEETGEADGPGWYGLVVFDDDDRAALSHLGEYCDAVAAIVSEDSNGFVDVVYFTSVDDARAEWSEVEQDVENWYGEE